MNPFRLLIRPFIPKAWRLEWRAYLAMKSRIRILEERLAETETTLDIAASDAPYDPSRDAGLNCQIQRARMIRDLFSRVHFEAFVETGTYRGNTTGFVAHEFHLPVYSCELKARYHFIAARRLRNVENIHLFHGDSRIFVSDLSRNVGLVAQTVCFYLDAHWYEDLPLVEEIQIIAKAWQHYVILIDDFKVPGDAGYGYDCYSEGRALSLDLIHSVIRMTNMSIFFPQARSAEETGARRGCVLLVSRSLEPRVRECPFLRPYMQCSDIGMQSDDGCSKSIEGS